MRLEGLKIEPGGRERGLGSCRGGSKQCWIVNYNDNYN